MRNPLSAIAITLTACASTPIPPERSWTQHMAAANAHDRRAAENVQAERAIESSSLAAYSCGNPVLNDPVLNDQLTSGTERLVLTQPCWDPSDEISLVRHQLGARKQRAAARAERRAAADLVRAELKACRNIPEHELGHSAFAHRRAILQVIPHRESEHIRGARIVFSPVLGLTEEWLRQAIQCQQARFTTFGKPASYLPEDPSLVDNARVSLTTEGDRVIVLIETDDDIAGNIVLERARRLISNRTATR